MSLTSGVSFSLLKISLATDPADAKTFSWMHETRDVRVLFDNYGAVTAHFNMFSIFTVFQDDAILERVNLAVKAREANEVVEHAQQTGKKLDPNVDVPTGVIYVRKNRAIAIRYRLSESKIRRMQLKFESDQDFDRVLSLLEDLGCHPTPHGTRSRDFSGFGRSSSVQAETDSQHRLTSSHFPSAKAASPTSLSSPAQRSSTYAYQSQLDDWRRPPTPLFPIQEDQSFHEDPVMQNTGGYDSESQRDTLRRRTAAARPENTISATSNELSRFHSSTALMRPSSMSKLTIAQLDNALTLTIPPRRELAFKRPASRQSISSRDGALERPPSSADLPELPKPSFINPPLIEGSSEFSMRTLISHPEETGGQQMDDAVSTTTKSDTRKPSTPGTTQKKAIAGKATGTKSTDRPFTATSSSSTNINFSPSTPITSNSVLGSISPSKDVHNALRRIDTAIGPPTNRRSTEQESLANYAELTYEDRMAVVEKLIVDGVSDENFIRLCEDVHGCWQRIGFGR